MRKLAAYTVVRLASALSWKPPAHRVRELFPATADATARNADPNAVYVVTGRERRHRLDDRRAAP